MVKYNEHMGNNHRETDKQKRPHENACHDEIIILRNIRVKPNAGRAIETNLYRLKEMYVQVQCKRRVGW